MMEGYAPENNTEISTALKNVETMTKDMHEMVKSLKAVTDKLTQRKGRNTKDPEHEAFLVLENFGIRTFKTKPEPENSVQEESSQKELQE